ncbi:helix-turn-helix domain-containing protein [Dermacoccus sp. Tok2021]|uniref:helix-turn-helix domain-containing protein n=1 Tax=Dermacoccus sp. Tok2021 TaxID=2826873 RepID=UPI001CA63061|nr:helix-turn-helix domain-containing protein [Dermacoccus sp. Tok2021]
MLRSVAVIAQSPVAAFELGVLVEVFGVDRTEEGVPAFDFTICTSQGAAVAATVPGISLYGASTLDGAATADLVAVPSSPMDEPPGDDVLDALRSASERGAYVLSMCSGTYALAWAGLLDGHRAATHWRYAAHLQHRFPRVHVDDSLLYAQAGNVITGAGTAAGIDACLHLVRLEHGSSVATKIARRMVVAPHRDGGQKQFIDKAIPPRVGGGLGALLDAVGRTLAEPHTVASMARQAGVSERTLARWFVDEVGATPHAWLSGQRVLASRHLLETTDLPMDAVARHSGFGDASTLRRHFQRDVGVSPATYRSLYSATQA